VHLSTGAATTLVHSSSQLALTIACPFILAYHLYNWEGLIQAGRRYLYNWPALA